MTAPDWTRHAIGWHVYPLGFTGAPVHRPDEAAAEVDLGTREGDGGRGPAGGFDHLTAWLDYVRDLGLNMLQLGPVHASQTHGYDVVDHYRLDPRLGDDAAFDRLLAAAHDRGIRVLLDGVFNHVGRGHPAVAEALAGEGPGAGLIAVGRDADGDPELPVFEGHGGLVELDHSSDAVADLVADVMTHWLRRGVDGWRLDAAYAVDPAFWARVLPRVRGEFPDAFIYGEVIHGDYPDIVARSGMDSVTEYELWKAAWSSLREENLFELEWTLRRHGGFAEAFRPVTFIGNHDVTRIASQVGQDKAVLALAVLMTVAGVPLIYYGDEQGYAGIKEERAGGDDEIRPAMPGDPSGLSDLGAWVHRAHQALIGLRRRHAWLADAVPGIVDVANGRLVYRVADPASDDALEVTLDVTGSPVAEIRGADGSLEYRFPEG